MQDHNKLPYGLTLIAVSVLGLMGWMRLTPASAQGDPNAPAQPPPRPGRMMMGGGASVAASGDYVYVVRGATLFQFKSSDLSLVTQKDIPAPNPPPAPAANP